MEQNRFKSPVFWAGMISAIGFFAKSFLGFELPQAELNTLVEAVLALVAAFGVGNNPQAKGHY